MDQKPHHLKSSYYHDVIYWGGELILVFQVAWSRPLNLRMNKMPKNDEHINFSAFTRWKNDILIPNRYFRFKDLGIAGWTQKGAFVPATTENYTKIHKKHPSPPLFRQTLCCSQALYQEMDNFNLPLLRRNVKRRCPIICGLLLAPDPTRNRTTSRCPSWLSCDK